MAEFSARAPALPNSHLLVLTHESILLYFALPFFPCAPCSRALSHAVCRQAAAECHREHASTEESVGGELRRRRRDHDRLPQAGQRFLLCSPPPLHPFPPHPSALTPHLKQDARDRVAAAEGAVAAAEVEAARLRELSNNPEVFITVSIRYLASPLLSSSPSLTSSSSTTTYYHRSPPPAGPRGASGQQRVRAQEGEHPRLAPGGKAQERRGRLAGILPSDARRVFGCPAASAVSQHGLKPWPAVSAARLPPHTCLLSEMFESLA